MTNEPISPAIERALVRAVEATESAKAAHHRLDRLNGQLASLTGQIAAAIEMGRSADAARGAQLEQISITLAEEKGRKRVISYIVGVGIGTGAGVAASVITALLASAV